MLLHIWGFDPGKVTGWSHLSVRDGEVSLFRTGEADHIEIGDMLLNNPAFSHDLYGSDVEIAFVCESYKPNPRQTPAPWSLETIGLIRYFASHYNIPFILVQPSEHKSLITDQRIKNAGLWTPGKRHANDSVSIALYYLIKEKGLLTSCLIQSEQNSMMTELG